MLDAARTMDETIGDELARSVLDVRQADRLVERLHDVVGVVQLDQPAQPVDSKHSLCEFGGGRAAVEGRVGKERSMFAQIWSCSATAACPDVEVFSVLVVQRTARGPRHVRSEINKKAPQLPSPGNRAMLKSYLMR